MRHALALIFLSASFSTSTSPLPACVGREGFDAGYGGCENYAPGQPSASYCNEDGANEECSECDQCADPPPPPAPPFAPPSPSLPPSLPPQPPAPPLSPGERFVFNPAELSDALASDSRTILLASGTFLLAATIGITRNVTLRADVPGQAVLDGQGSVRVLDLSGHIVVRIEGLIITNGTNANAADASLERDGGCIYAGGGVDLHIMLSTISNCRAIGADPHGNGGALHVHSSAVTLGPSVTISNCHADLYAGGVDAIAGSTVILGPSSTIHDCTARDAGGVYVEDSRMTLQPWSSIINCSAGLPLSGVGLGGGVAATRSNVTLEAHSTISGCTAASWAGGIHGYEATVTLESHSTISGCSAGDDGGGIYAHRSSTVILRPSSTIRDCFAGNVGGGLCIYRSTTLLVDGAVFEANRASGGATSLSSDASTSAASTIANVTFRGHAQSTTAIYSAISWVCPLGTYMPKGGDFAGDLSTGSGCLYGCPNGYYGTGFTSECTGKCWNGHYCPERAAVPTPCPPGTRLPTTTLGYSRASCIPCIPGTFNPNASLHADSCPACPAGSYSAALHAINCTVCPAGGYCAVDGAVSKAQAFTQCPEGTYGPHSGADSSDACVSCKPGTANPATNRADAAACTPCDPGYASAAGASTCSHCGPGSYAAGRGATACAVCEVGHWCSASAQVPCGEDRWNNVSGSHDQRDCRLCPKHSSSRRVENASSRVQCVCDVGHFDNAALSSAAVPDCTPCIIGTSCTAAGTTLRALPLHRGYWRPSATSLDVRRCPDAIKGCASTGSATCNTSTSGCVGGPEHEQRCLPELEGPLCRLCANTSDAAQRVYYVPASDSQPATCTLCGSYAAVTIVVSLAIIAGMLILLAVLGTLLHRCPSLVKTLRRFQAVAKPETKLKIIVGFYMLVTKIDETYEVASTPEMQRFLSYISFGISLGLGSSENVLTCSGVGGYHGQLVLWMLVPPSLIGVVFLGCSVRLGCRRRLAHGALMEMAMPLIVRLLFLLYPLVTNVAFRAFSCYPEFDDGRSYLIADVNVQCTAGGEFTDAYVGVRVTAWFAIGVYAFGLIALNAALLYAAREAILENRSTPLSRAIRFLYREYEPWAYWWELCEMGRRLILVGVFVTIEQGSILQIMIGTAFSVAYMLLQIQASPYLERTDDYLANCVSFELVIYFLVCIVFKIGGLSELQDVKAAMPRELQRDFFFDSVTLSLVIVFAVAGALAVSLVILIVQIADEAARMRREMRLPQCEWEMAAGQSYVCFLSHYKVEAGAQARYVKDSLDKMLGCPSFLDSSALADLRKLFGKGVHASEVLVLMLSEHLLTRPWCLLEIREAMATQKPIVLLELVGPGQRFDYDDAFALLADLEGEMPRRNPACLGELKEHLGGMTMLELQDVARAALEQGRARHVPQLNIHGTTNQLHAELMDLIEQIAAATGRAVEWKGGSAAGYEMTGVRNAVGRCLAPGAASVCILHDPDAAAHALRLREGMARTLAQPCDTQVPAPHEMQRALERVAGSPYVLLLQTRGVLSQPWALLALFHAALKKLPIVCVVVSGGGYDFGGAKEHLEHLGERLDAAALAQLSSGLAQLAPPRTLQALQTVLAQQVPHIISVVYTPSGTENALSATVRDVRDKTGLMEKSQTTRKKGPRRGFRPDIWRRADIWTHRRGRHATETAMIADVQLERRSMSAP